MKTGPEVRILSSAFLSVLYNFSIRISAIDRGWISVYTEWKIGKRRKTHMAVIRNFDKKSSYGQSGVDSDSSHYDSGRIGVTKNHCPGAR